MHERSAPTGPPKRKAMAIPHAEPTGGFQVQVENHAVAVASRERRACEGGCAQRTATASTKQRRRNEPTTSVAEARRSGDAATGAGPRHSFTLRRREHERARHCERPVRTETARCTATEQTSKLLRDAMPEPNCATTRPLIQPAQTTSTDRAQEQTMASVFEGGDSIPRI